MAAFCSFALAAKLAVILCVQRSCSAIADDVSGDGNSSVGPGSDSPFICDLIIEDNHQFYSKETVGGNIDDYWIELQNHISRERFLHGPPYGMWKSLTFDFPFYGQPTKHIYIATRGITTQGELRMSGVVVSHYIYPYFHPNMSEDSVIYFDNSDDKFIVEWRNVSLENDNETTRGPYQFQTIVHRNGTVLFLYKKVPSDHIFKGPLAGLGSNMAIMRKESDSIDFLLGYVKHQDVIVDSNQIRDGAVIKFTPLSNCELARDSQTCGSGRFLFYCKKCKMIRHCSDETGRQRQKWLKNNCKHETPDNCKTAQRKSSSKTVAIVVIIAIAIVLVSLLGGWTYYAYKHPNTPSGRWLIEHRPSQWLGLYRSRKGSSMEDQDRTSQEANDADPEF